MTYRLRQLMLLLIPCILACRTLDVPPKFIEVITRDASGAVVESQKIDLINCHGEVITTLLTNKVGYEKIPTKDFLNQLEFDSGCHLFLRYQELGPSRNADEIERKGVRLSRFRTTYDIYLAPPDNSADNKVADMHYHHSAKAGNNFLIYEKSNVYLNKKMKRWVQNLPENINWLKLRDELEVLHNGEWIKSDLEDWVTDLGDAENVSKAKRLLEGKLVRPAKSDNHVLSYTQATNSHRRDGNVYLAFNSITPFESSLNFTSTNRLANALLKSRVNIRYLRYLGGAKFKEKWKNEDARLTSWEAFKLEHDVIARQAKNSNNTSWEYYNDARDFDKGVPLILNVVEGGHIFHDQKWPMYIRYNLADPPPGSRDEFYKTQLYDQFVNREWLPDNPEPEEVTTRQKFKAVDSVLTQSIEEKVFEMKALDPRIHMVTISHLGYNGMIGHAFGIDVSPGGLFNIGRVTARRVYGLRLRNNYSSQFLQRGAFYSISGINKYGEKMIESLLSSSNGHPVLLDLKHCDYESRQRIFKDFTIMENGDTLPPICSHCAVNGLSEVYYSPFNDNYALIDASFTTTFNPFPLNIYDEEISRFADHNGIIGLPLEQRVLGGYIGARRRTKGNYSTTELDSLRKFFLAPAFNNGSTKFNREDHTRNRLSLMYLRDSSLFSAAKASIMQQTSVDDESALRLLFDEYWSALPFMENLFHIIDELIYNSKYQQTEGAVDPDIRPWEHVCIGSDLDGFMDPIDICPTASHYPEFKHKLKYLIPIFLQERCSRKPVPRRTELAFSSYFGEGVSLDQCLDQLFYDSLRDFTAKYFNYPEP